MGLRANHSASDLALAVLQGAAYEVERIRQVAESLTGPIEEIIAVGGGSRIRRWVQIKADVAGRPIYVPAQAEATALGAALLAGVGAGVFTGHDEVQGLLRQATSREADETDARAGRRTGVVKPDPVEHRLHTRLLDGPYAALQEPLRAASRAISAALREDEGN